MPTQDDIFNILREMSKETQEEWRKHVYQDFGYRQEDRDEPKFYSHTINFEEPYNPRYTRQECKFVFDEADQGPTRTAAPKGFEQVNLSWTRAKPGLDWCIMCGLECPL